MNNKYFISVEADDMQDAISTELGLNVEEDLAQEVLDNFIDTSEVTAESGCSAEEECLSMMLALMKQIGEHKTQIIQYINEAEVA